MRKSSVHTSGKSLSWAFAFLGLLAFVILLSAVWKFVVFLQQSTFDGNHQFNIAVTGEHPQIISFNPDQENVTIVHVESPTDAAKKLLIPLDGTVKGNSDEGLKHILFSALIHHLATISPVDLVKLWWFSNTLPKDSVSQVNLSSNDQQSQKQIPQLFQDKTLYSEGKSITIVNATGISGLGSQIARYLTNVGANVIMVSTADTDQDISSMSYTGEASYTIRRLEQLFHIKATPAANPSSISDITIIIGKDIEKSGIL